MGGRAGGDIGAGPGTLLFTLRLLRVFFEGACQSIGVVIVSCLLSCTEYVNISCHTRNLSYKKIFSRAAIDLSPRIEFRVSRKSERKLYFFSGRDSSSRVQLVQHVFLCKRVSYTFLEVLYKSITIYIYISWYNVFFYIRSSESFSCLLGASLHQNVQ